MTQAVPTEGFAAPQGTPAATPQAVEPQQAAPAARPQGNGLDAAVAALTAALQQTKQPEPQAAQVQGEPVGLNSVNISEIDDPIIQSMATVMQTVGKGVDFDRALGKALENGRADLIDVAYLKEAGGANAEQLITIAKGIVQAVEAKSRALATGVYELAGGETQWSASVAVFNSGAPEEVRMIVAQMLDSGQERLIKAAAKMVVDYSKGTGAIPNANPLLNSGAATLPTAQALDKAGFQEELRKLDPSARDYLTKRDELFARRQLGRKLGK